ncbi:hypothetical protein K502DRAFT_366792 [Neoconidiobolus thromboides FSU 785]|nr:hypothetical protein K502DRAFT_366792 [Neoconidiobolus thromboides FSU 785]
MPTLKTPSKSQLRCNQCIKIHRQCCRSLPECERCTQRGVTCTYTLKTNYKKQTYKFEDKVATFRVNEPIEEQLEITKKVTEDSNYQTKFRFNVIRLPKDFNKNYTVISIMQQFPRKEALGNLMTLIQYPSPYKPSEGISLFLKLTEKLGIFVRKQLQKVKLEQKSIEHSNENQTILNLAYQHYFDYNNLILPLFIEREFQFDTKNTVLKAAILASGLSWLKPDSTITRLLKYFEAKLYNNLHLCYKISPTLENLQIIIITISSLSSFSWLGKLKEKLLAQAYRITTFLAIHKTCYKLSKTRNQERGLAYSALIYLHLNSNVLAGNYLPIPFKSEALMAVFITIQAQLTNNNRKRELNLTKVCHILFSSYYNELAILIYDLCLLKNEYINCNQSPSQLANKSKELLNQLKQISFKYVMLFTKLGNFKGVKNKLEIINQFKNHILFNYHYHNYFINSLKFYTPTHPDKATTETPPADIEQINNTLSQCQQIIKYADLLPKFHMLTFGIAQLAQCLMFVKRYKKKEDTGLQTSLLSGELYLKGLMEVESFAMMVRLNLWLLGLVEDSLGKGGKRK